MACLALHSCLCLTYNAAYSPEGLADNFDNTGKITGGQCKLYVKEVSYAKWRHTSTY